MRLIDPMLTELEQEAKATRKMLERLPEDKLAWKPHAKSMTLGRLAAHIADVPVWVDAILAQDESVLGAQQDYTPPTATTVSEALESLDKNLTYALDALKKQSDERLLATWHLTDRRCNYHGGAPHSCNPQRDSQSHHPPLRSAFCLSAFEQCAITAGIWTYRHEGM